MKLIANPKIRLFALTASAIAITGIGTTAFFYQKNQESTDKLNREILDHERTLGERMELEQEILRLKNLIPALEGQNHTLDQKLLLLRKELEGKQLRLQQLSGVQATNVSLQKDLAELRLLRETLEKQLGSDQEQIRSLTLALTAAQKQNQALTAEIATLKARPGQTKETLVIAEPAHADQFMITPLRGRHNKLTVKAARTKTLVLSCTIDQPINPQNQAVSLIMTTPSGSRVVFKGAQLEMVLSPRKTTTGVIQEVMLTVRPEQKLVAGTYYTELFSGNLSLGEAGFSLR